MAASDLSLCLDLVGWGALAVLGTFMCLIARMFQRRTGVPVPTRVLGVAAAAYVGAGAVEAVGRWDSFPNGTSAALAVAGVTMTVAVLRVYRLMAGGSS